MVFHSLALRDVVTLWVESVLILDRSKGLAVFAGVSSSVNCRFSVSLAEWALVMFYSALCFVSLRLGASRVECSSLPHSLFLLSPFGFSYQSGLFSLLLPYPGVNPLASIVTLVYSFPADSDVCFYDGVDMCGLLEVLFPTSLYALSA